MAINKSWHIANPMPKAASTGQRIRWHLRHQDGCACPPIPQSILTEIAKGALGSE
jgi:hypothetical protein